MSIDHLNKIRDKIGKEFDEASWYGRRSLDYFEAGFDASTEHWRKICAGLVEALEKLRADYQFGNGQVYEDIEKALQAYRKQIGGADE